MWSGLEIGAQRLHNRVKKSIYLGSLSHYSHSDQTKLTSFKKNKSKLTFTDKTTSPFL